MSKGIPKDKKLIRVPSRLVAKLTRASNLEEKAFYDFTTESLEQAVRAHNMGISLKEIVDFYELMEIQRASGAVITPKDVLDYLISKLYPKEKAALQKKWYESGRWYGKYLDTKLRGRDAVEVFGRILSASKWDLNEVNVEREGETVMLRCVSFTLPLERTELLVRFLEGVMHSLGYETKKLDSTRGIITMEFTPA